MAGSDQSNLIEDAIVKISGKSNPTLSNVNGIANIRLSKIHSNKKSIEVEIEKEGYETLTKTINLKGQQYNYISGRKRNNRYL